jgi:Initiator Replication protein
MSRTAMQKSNGEGFPKAAEVIEITGAYELEAMDRAALNILYQHAHDSGRLADPDAEFEIELSRLRPSKHESNDRIRDALLRLMRVVVTIPYTAAPTPDYPDGEPRLILTPLFAFFDLPEKETAPSTVHYGLPKKLQPIIASSGRWGRIKAEVVCAMTSKYAIALYELVQLRANLQRCVETFPIDRFRDLLGVPPGKLTRGNDLVRWALETAAIEVNGLSDYGVRIDPVRKNPRAPITAVTITWWRKEGDEYRDIIRELRQPKVGRMARLRGTVEQIMPAKSKTSLKPPGDPAGQHSDA